MSRTATGRTKRLQAGAPLVFACLALLCVADLNAALPDYDVLDEILARNVRNGFIDYDGIAEEPRFAEFIAQLDATRVNDLATSDERLAFYINAYNVLAIQGILNGRSPESWWGRRGFFQRQTFAVLGEELTLDTLENERLAAFDETRIHFALVCASLSCPRLQSRAFRAETLNEQLHEAAMRFINDPTRNRFDTGRKIAFVSPIFALHADDFIAAGGTQQRYLARFVDDAETEDTLREEAFDVRFLPHDWNLNGHYSKRD